MVDKKLRIEGQERIWDHFQNEGEESFSASRSRLKYIVGQINSGRKMLNIGVGGGILEELAIGKSIDTHSLDPSERAIERLREKCDIGDKAKVGYSEKIPFEDDRFDVVVMSEVLEHLNEEKFDLSVEEVSRVLKKNGTFIATVPFEEDLVSNYAVCPNCGENFHRWGHQQSFSIQKLKQMLEDRSFLMTTIEARCFPDWSRKGGVNLLKCCLRYLLGRFGVGIAQPNIFLKAVKVE
jgi:ubiquinone/menaquinone biosynthesis C-methylase UbiE